MKKIIILMLISLCFTLFAKDKNDGIYYSQIKIDGMIKTNQFPIVINSLFIKEIQFAKYEKDKIYNNSSISKYKDTIKNRYMLSAKQYKNGKTVNELEKQYYIKVENNAIFLSEDDKEWYPLKIKFVKIEPITKGMFKDDDTDSEEDSIVTLYLECKFFKNEYTQVARAVDWK